jgi:multiple sugar transport system permease protein
MTSYTASRRFANLGSHAFLILSSILMIAPFFWMVTTSFKTIEEIYLYPPAILPRSIHFQNFAHVLETVPFGRFYLNSIIVTTIITISQVATAVLAGYVFARVPFPGRDLIFYLYLATLIVPNQVTMLPLFLLISALGWIDTYQALSVPFLASAFAVFFLRQFFSTIPRDLDDAARIEGCGRLRFIWYIGIPLVKPAIATITLFTFLAHWDEYLWPLLVTNTTLARTLPIGLRFFVEEAGWQYHYMMAGSLMAVVPVIILFFIAQRQFIQGITLTGMKG